MHLRGLEKMLNTLALCLCVFSCIFFLNHQAYLHHFLVNTEHHLLSGKIINYGKSRTAFSLPWVEIISIIYLSNWNTKSGSCTHTILQSLKRCPLMYDNRHGCSSTRAKYWSVISHTGGCSPLKRAGLLRFPSGKKYSETCINHTPCWVDNGLYQVDPS